MTDDPSPRFERVVHNEGFATYRDMEPDLGLVLRALVGGWRPTLEGLRGIAAQRAGYLVSVAMELGAPRDGAWLDALQSRVGVAVAAPFFHRERVFAPTADAVAQRWRLTGGLERARLRQLLAWPHVA